MGRANTRMGILRSSGIMKMVMRSRLSTVFALLVCLSGLWWHAAATTVARDLNALRVLQAAWSGPGSNLPDWNGNDPCGDQWVGIICDGPTGDQVTTLSLAGYNLTGGIPSAIGSLSGLLVLELSFNELLGGQLPRELGRLTALTSLSIRKSGIVGPIPPDLGSCTQLTFLALDQNGLTGSIPDLLGNLAQLYWFDISENSISGTLPVSSNSVNRVGLDNLTNCAHFHFNNNTIAGNIPDEIFNASLLKHLLLDSNRLQGSIPAAVGNGKSLLILRLSNNLLSGDLPSALAQATGLLQINLDNNQFTGVLPDLSSLTQLLLLDVSNNQLDIQGVPAWLNSLTSLTTLTANSANFTGNLNSGIFSLPEIQTISLRDNALNGTLAFTGSFPSSLVIVDLENNDFTGVQAGNANTAGIEILLSGNPFCATVGKGSDLCAETLDGPYSWVSTPNASCLAPCGGGKTLNPNDCSCAFPLICNMQLTSPPFSTFNSTFISHLSNEWAADFHLAPEQVFIGYANFTNDGRLFFNILFFPLSGNALPVDVVTNISSQLSRNIPKIAEAPYLMRDFTPPPASATSSKKSTSTAVIIGVVVAVVLVACVIAIIVFYAVRQKRRADRAETSRPFGSWGGSHGDPGGAPQLKGARWFSLAELKKATNNFSDSNEIGSGGYGKVYRADLITGEVVAVKRAADSSKQGATEFKTEIELLSRVHHRNLVGLVGFCYELNEEMLVYEFMSNGTLREHLLGATPYPLSWESRVNIALGSARGLAYLHELANPAIIHRDIKSSNILLDDKMIAKVADFGLSKLAPDQAGNNPHVSTQVKGTLGYLDPEYYMTNQLSEKSDIYSFGVVLLEMLSARPPIEQGRYIVREVRTALDKGGFTAFKPLLDPFLADYPVKQLEAMLNLALRCVEEAGSQRPTMNEVVKELEVIAGHSGSGVHITMEPQGRSEDLYGAKNLTRNSDDPSFDYSGTAIVPPVVEPK